MLDRIDIRVPTRAINNEKLLGETSESSSEIKQRIIKARNIQNIRYENFANINKKLLILIPITLKNFAN